MSVFSPQLINTLSQFFIRKGREIPGVDLEDGSITQTKLAFTVPTTEALDQVSSDLSQVQTQVTGLGGQVDSTTNALQASLDALTLTVQDLQDSLTAAEARITALEDVISLGATYEIIQVVNEANPLERVIITVADGIVTDVTRETI